MKGKKNVAEETRADEMNTDLAVVSDGAKADGDDVKHADVRRQVIALRSKADDDYWELAVVLSEVHGQSYYRDWGFDTFQEYVEQELDIHLRKAQYLVKLQEWFFRMTPAIQKWMRSLGWTKARMLMHVVTQENAAEWRNRVDGKTVAEIEAMLKGERDAADESSREGGGDADGKPKSLTIKGMHPEMMELWERASRHAGEVGETDKPCQMLNLICIDYLAGSTNLMNKTDLLRRMEKTLGLKLIAMRASDDAIVFGGEYIDDSDQPTDE